MSKITAKFNFESNSWIIDNQLVTPEDSTLEFVFISNNEYTKMSNVKFGYKLESQTGIISSGSYPPEGVRYEMTNSSPLAIVQITTVAEDDYKLSVYLTENADPIEAELQFKSPIPPCKYASWKWENKVWTAPIPKPDGPWLWNEDQKIWEKADKMFPYPEN